MNIVQIIFYLSSFTLNGCKYQKYTSTIKKLMLIHSFSSEIKTSEHLCLLLLINEMKIGGFRIALI
jgi:hypothetical protein